MKTYLVAMIVVLWVMATTVMGDIEVNNPSNVDVNIDEVGNNLYIVEITQMSEGAGSVSLSSTDTDDVIVSLVVKDNPLQLDQVTVSVIQGGRSLATCRLEAGVRGGRGRQTQFFTDQDGWRSWGFGESLDCD